MTQGSEAKIYSTGGWIVDNCEVPLDDLPIFIAHRMNCDCWVDLNAEVRWQTESPAPLPLAP
jgi:hypothetical protein